MERTQLFDLMAELKLFSMKAAFDEIMATAVKRQHEPQRIVGDLLNAEINEKQARSIKYQLTIAKLPLAKDLEDFQFEGTPINQTLVNDLAGGGFFTQQRNAILVGVQAPARPIWPSPLPEAASDPVPAAASTTWSTRQPPGDRGPNRTAGSYSRTFDPDGLHRPRRARLPAVRSIRRPAAVRPHQPALRTNVHRRHYQSRLRRMAQRGRRRQDDDRVARPPDLALVSSELAGIAETRPARAA
jgi:IstB-like ATP binding protein